jgi:hypothetical protein
LIRAKGTRSWPFAVEDTTARGGGNLHTDDFTIADGNISQAHVGAPHDMASPDNLSRFVAHTLDEAERSGASQSWIDLVDHGAGDGGGLESDSTHHIMRMPQIAQSIADGVALHAKEHPEDAHRGVDGIVANQCLMSTLGFADALSRVGVKYLAASPETMLSPGAPTTIADAIAKNGDDPRTMARAAVDDVMHTRYDAGVGEPFGPAAAFSVLDLDPQKIAKMRANVKVLNDALIAASRDRDTRASIRGDVKSVEGMVRFPQSTGLPWHADRPAIAAYDALASDARLDPSTRAKAAAARDAVSNIVLAHGESADFAPFADADYSDAVGPTVHLPLSHKQIDPWAPAVSETDNAFYRDTDGDGLAHAIA